MTVDVRPSCYPKLSESGTAKEVCMTIPLDTLRRRSTQVSFTLLCLMLLVVSALAQSPRSTVRGTSDSGPQGKEITKLLGHLRLENLQAKGIFFQQPGT